MEQTFENQESDCVSMQIKLCGEVLKKVRAKQEEHYAQTGQKCSKRLAIFKLILGK